VPQVPVAFSPTILVGKPGIFASYTQYFLAMPDTPEARARQNIDRLLTEAGWIVQSRDETNITAGRGVAIREFPLKSGYGEADYLLYVDAIPAGVVEAKKEGETLTSHEIQTEKYSVGLPAELKPYRKPTKLPNPRPRVKS
jgi:type I restriction enzyme R subunit